MNPLLYKIITSLPIIFLVCSFFFSYEYILPEKEDEEIFFVKETSFRDMEVSGFFSFERVAIIR